MKKIKLFVPGSLEIAVKSLIYCFLAKALITFSGIPQTPYPPNNIEDPDLMSAIASSTVDTTLLIPELALDFG